MLKQNQLTHSPIPGQQVQLKQHDHLKVNSLCKCSICQNGRQRPNPQIFIDHMYEELKSQKSKMLSNKSVTLSSVSSTMITNRQKRIEGFSWYLRKLGFQCKTLPNFPFLDTMIMEKGQLGFCIYSQNQKSKIIFNNNNPSISQSGQSNLFPNNNNFTQTIPFSLAQIKHRLLQRKNFYDIQYKKFTHKQLNPSFQWAQLDHQSQKLIKQFQKKIKYTDQMLNRVAYVVQRQKQSQFYKLTQSQDYRFKENMLATVQQGVQDQEKVLTKYEFGNLFDKTRMKICQLDQLDYIQLFPIMYGEEQHSYVKQIKYFRKFESIKQLFKQAQSYVLSWLEKNQSLQKMQSQFLHQYFYSDVKNLKKLAQYPHTHIKRLIPSKQQQYLMYLSYKLLLHFQAQTNISIQQCLLQFITINQGATFYLKSIKYIKYNNKPQVQQKQNKLPSYKHIDKQDYIYDLKKQMKQTFEKFQHQFTRLNNDWDNFEDNWLDDMKKSDKIFKQVKGYKIQQENDSKLYKKGVKLNANDNNDDESVNLHRILRSNDQRYKEDMLGLNDSHKKKEGSRMIKNPPKTKLLVLNK